MFPGGKLRRAYLRTFRTQSRLALHGRLWQRIVIKELIFEVREDDVDGGYAASALGYGIHTQGDTLDELRRNVREAIECHFDKPEDVPGIVRLHFVRDEVLAV